MHLESNFAESAWPGKVSHADDLLFFGMAYVKTKLHRAVTLLTPACDQWRRSWPSVSQHRMIEDGLVSIDAQTSRITSV